VANRAGQILGFRNVNGNTSPLIDISGNLTQLSNPVPLTIDSSGKLYAMNDSGSTVMIFAHGANGNVAPTLLGGSNSVIGPSEGIAIDHNGLIYVSAYDTTNAYNSQLNITVFAAGSTGNATPVRRITGAATLLTQPSGMAFDSSNDLWVGNYGGALQEFAASANGNVAPTASVSGTNTKFSNPFSVAIDSNNRVIVGDYDGTSVSIFAANPTGNATPVSVISGANTGFQQVGSVGVDALNNIYVTDFTTNSISVFPSTANGNVFPTLVISGSSTLLNDAWYPSIF
jgi:6-phosphogluconolactonase (cycloisomerase 2 family)